jgi:hypothetical protein
MESAGFSLPKIDDEFDAWLQQQLDSSSADEKVIACMKRPQNLLWRCET